MCGLKQKPNMPKQAAVVEQFILQLAAEQQESAHALRAIIRKAAKHLQESIKWGYPCYVGVGLICSILPTCHFRFSCWRSSVSLERSHAVSSLCLLGKFSRKDSHS